MKAHEIIQEFLNASEGDKATIVSTLDVTVQGPVSNMDDFERFDGERAQRIKTFDVVDSGERWRVTCAGEVTQGDQTNPSEITFTEPLARSPEGGVYRISTMSVEES